MKIAYISYEFPPDTAMGGISTYVYQASKMMYARGHHIEVFCGTQNSSKSEMIDGIYIHRVKSEGQEFSTTVLSIFSIRHKEIGFDIVESPEFREDGREIRKAYPQLPMIVKLHTPWYLIKRINDSYLTFFDKCRFILGSYSRGRFNKPFWSYNRLKDGEYHFTKNATSIHTPSISLGNIISEEWDIDRALILNIPYPYIPSSQLLQITGLPKCFTVLFAGRLEFRKGIQIFGSLIPLVLNKNKNIKFLFVGKDQYHPKKGIKMKDYLIKKNKKYISSMEFIEGVDSTEMPEIYKRASVCLYPSLWENFPNVCLEAMGAGRAIIGSCEGGMLDMLTNPTCGIVKAPNDIIGIANEILFLAENPDKCIQFGVNARKALLEKYNENRIGNLMEEAYQKDLQN